MFSLLTFCLGDLIVRVGYWNLLLWLYWCLPLFLFIFWDKFLPCSPGLPQTPGDPPPQSSPPSDRDYRHALWYPALFFLSPIVFVLWNWVLVAQIFTIIISSCGIIPFTSIYWLPLFLLLSFGLKSVVSENRIATPPCLGTLVECSMVIPCFHLQSVYFILNEVHLLEEQQDTVAFYLLIHFVSLRLWTRELISLTNCYYKMFIQCHCISFPVDSFTCFL